MGLGILITVNNRADLQLTSHVSSVEVYEKMDQATSFRIRFMVDICDNDIARGLEETTDPGSILGVLVEVNDQLNCLVSGPVTRQEAHLEHGGAGSWLEVEGNDTSVLMDKETAIRSQTGSDSDIVSSILSPRYVMQTDVESTPNTNHTEDKHTAVQKETDLSFVRRLAQRNGFHFWITYDKDGNSTGHFKSRSLQGEPHAELLVNLPKANIDNLQIKWDTTRLTQTVGSQINQNTKEIIKEKVELSDSDDLGAKGLKKLVGEKPNAMQISPAIDEAGELKRRGEATLKDAQWFINATCKTTLDRVCKLIKSHTIINIQGLGERHSGKYYVSGVKHIIDPVSHSMDIELARNAWGNQAAGGLLNNSIF